MYEKNQQGENGSTKKGSNVFLKTYKFVFFIQCTMFVERGSIARFYILILGV
jgi:hypothetical protein